MTPEIAVARLAEIVVARIEFSQDEIYVAMADAAIPPVVADRAYKFMQAAWTREFLGHLGVKFSPDYYCFNANGTVIESGLLAEEPFFKEARRLAPQHILSKGLKQLALMSAEIQAVNELVSHGSKLENLVMSPAFFFLEAPNGEGMANAHRFIEGLGRPPATQRLDGESQAAKAQGSGTAAPLSPSQERDQEAGPVIRNRRIKLTKTVRPWWQFWK
jgi:hypothetical protein